MRAIAPAAIAFALAAVPGCATVGADPEKVPLCSPVAELQPLPEAGVCAEAEIGAYGSTISDRIVARMNGALVRVEFDEAARARSVCVESSNPRASWSERRYVAALSDPLAQLPQAPACLASRRLDLNRYEAAIADIEYAEQRCSGQNRDFGGCMEQYGDWIVRDRFGWTRPFLFVAPEVANPPDLDASDTVSRCWRTEKNHRFEPQAVCIQAAGWEMLEPPVR